jgi:type I site-specific restriction endonuclease
MNIQQATIWDEMSKMSDKLENEMAKMSEKLEKEMTKLSNKQESDTAGVARSLSTIEMQLQNVLKELPRWPKS